MCGVSGTELVLIIIVALVVAGPKDLPRMLRTVGQYAGRLRRMAAELRAQSGIDDALRSEGLSDDINEIRKLARGELDGVARAARYDDDAPARPIDFPAPAAALALASGSGYRDGFTVAREREYPRDGADCYGCLPDNAIVYLEVLPKSKLARDPLYMLGDASAELPPEEAPAEATDEESTDGDAPAAEPVASSPAEGATRAPAPPPPSPASEGT